MHTPEKCTTALKRAVAEKREVEFTDDSVLLGTEKYSKELQTTYANQRGVFYSLYSVANLYCERHLDHGAYIWQCKEKNIDPVSFMDREKILSDISIPPISDRIKILLPLRSQPLNIDEIYQRYVKEKKSRHIGIKYIVVPQALDQGIEKVLSILKEDGQALLHADGVIEHSGCLYRVVNSCKDVSSLKKIAAIFIDGTMWQFRDWPKEILDVLKTTPMLYLQDEHIQAPPSSLPQNTTILRTNDSKVSLSLISRAFWSILGHKVH